jgi:hypothetical protein
MNNSPDVEEVRLRLPEDKLEKILKKPSDNEDSVDFFNFIQYLF